MMSDFELVCESTKSPKCVGEVGTDFIAAAQERREIKVEIDQGGLGKELPLLQSK